MSIRKTLQGPPGIPGESGTPGQSNSVFAYIADTGATSGYPGDGLIRWNNATQTSATTIIVSHIDANGQDNGSILEVLETVAKFRLQHATNNAEYQEWSITGTPILIDAELSTERWEVPVSLSSGSYSFGDAAELLLILAAGLQGEPGDAATIAIGNVTTGAPGSSASVTNVGTANAAVLDIEIPRGDPGTNGTNGIDGDVVFGAGTITTTTTTRYLSPGYTTTAISTAQDRRMSVSRSFSRISYYANTPGSSALGNTITAQLLKNGAVVASITHAANSGSGTATFTPVAYTAGIDTIGVSVIKSGNITNSPTDYFVTVG